MRASVKLQKEIELLEEQQRNDFARIKGDLNDALEYVQPVNIIKRTIRDVAKDPDIREDMFKVGLNMATNLLTSKVLAGQSSSAVKNTISSFLSKTIKNYVAGNSGNIKEMARKFALNILNKISKNPSRSNEETGDITPAHEPA